MSRNGYSYAEANPINYTDPSGRFPWLIIGGFAALTLLLSGDSVQPNRSNATDQMVGEMALGVLCDACDVALTIRDIHQDGFHPLHLLGLLPVIPASWVNKIVKGLGWTARKAGGAIRKTYHLTQRGWHTLRNARWANPYDLFATTVRRVSSVDDTPQWVVDLVKYRRISNPGMTLDASHIDDVKNYLRKYGVGESHLKIGGKSHTTILDANGKWYLGFSTGLERSVQVNIFGVSPDDFKIPDKLYPGLMQYHSESAALNELWLDLERTANPSLGRGHKFTDWEPCGSACVFPELNDAGQVLDGVETTGLTDLIMEFPPGPHYPNGGPIHIIP